MHGFNTSTVEGSKAAYGSRHGDYTFIPAALSIFLIPVDTAAYSSWKTLVKKTMTGSRAGRPSQIAGPFAFVFFGQHLQKFDKFEGAQDGLAKLAQGDQG
jgi:hypothetical protein